MLENIMRSRKNHKTIEQLKDIMQTQKRATQLQGDDYMVGLYNGMEFALAMFEDREPEFMTIVQKQVEEQEKLGRTDFHGVIQKGAKHD